ncbi:MAG: M4 family metallopeptidase, partial [Bacteroidota bacterium]|nr:M4 family metallopeptidase [Bacteroidota bacterium]
ASNNAFNNDLSVVHITSGSTIWSNPAAVSAHYNAGVAYEYFRTIHGRNSFDNLGGSIYSIINVADDDGTSLENAFWNGKAMFYGNGGSAFKPLAASLDVAGHEMTHGVVQNTANLEYEGESGAINESMADVFGSMMDRDDWLIGEEVVRTTHYPSGALRSLSNPHNGGTGLSHPGYQPMHVSEKYTGSQDNGGVHINSGIPNHAYYLFATAIGKEKAEKIYYRTLSTYLTRSSNFADLRIAVVQASKDLYGDGSAEMQAAENAFAGVGIGGPAGGNKPKDIPENKGQDFLLSYDTDISNPNRLYRSTTEGADFIALSTTQMKKKPSVTDDGKYAYFVSTDSRIRRISLDPANKEEIIVQNQPMWDNVAISKDGKRLAAVTSTIDTSIYVYDFGSAQWTRFYLYNPTFGDEKTEGPRYAD